MIASSMAACFLGPPSVYVDAELGRCRLLWNRSKTSVRRFAEYKLER